MEDHQPVPVPDGGVPSMLDELRAHRDRMRARESRDLKLDVPFWRFEDTERSRIVVQYHPVGISAMSALVGPDGNVRSDLLWPLVDVLVLACDRILVRDRPDAEPSDFDPSLDVPVGFDERLANVLGYSTDDGARGVAYQLFGGNERAEFALMAHFTQLNAWVTGVETRVSEAVLGESSGTTR